MAPEQIAGAEVTVRSDIYALGLVLYEIFTGQRALEGKNLAELIHKREQSGITPPSAIVRDLDLAIERVIMRCLRPDPDERPASALLVAASLPGGDPLAAALAAGETPSPAMVAAAGGRDVVPLGTALATAAWIVLSLLALLVTYERVMLINRVPISKPPEALQDRAAEALAKLGYAAKSYATAYGLGFSLDYANYIDRTSSAPDRWRQLAGARPETLLLWYRTSPRPLIPVGPENRVQGQNPPLSVGGMAIVVVDGSGRLAEFLAVPMPFDEDTPRQPTDWSVLFEAAGLPMAAFTPATPRLVPPVYADERISWEGHIPEHPDQVFRVDAAAFHGRPVSFAIVGPWTQSARSAPLSTPLISIVTSSIEALLMPAMMLAGAFLARRNLKLGRGDRRGAFRAATFLFCVLMTAWLLRGHVLPLGQDMQRFFAAFGSALFDAGLLWVTYLGIEPYIRRYAPDSLIGWTRLIGGNWNDPTVGKDVMIGVSAGLAMTVAYAVHNLIPPLFGQPEPMPLTVDPNLLLGTREVLAYLLGRIGSAIQGAMLCVVTIVTLLIWLRRRWLVAITGVALFTPVAINGMFGSSTPMLNLAIGAILISVFVFTIVRFGLLATVAALATHFVLLRAPTTIHLTTWRGPAGLWFVGLVAVAGLGACYIARRGAAGEALADF
jgi:serine/threonine-protein kinase